MKLIADTFANLFAPWKITLPEKDIETRSRGCIKEASWLIQYCFGKNETGEYLDYYAAHRMTNDSHVRIYADGKKENLPSISSIRRTSKDPIKDKRLEDEHYEHNRKVVEMLAEKGFDKFTINMFLHAGMDKKK